MLTTWPVLTEAMYLGGRRGGPAAQQVLSAMVRRGLLVIASPGEVAVQRVLDLMDRFSSVPMALADASLVALAEERHLDRVFTLDSDFHIYRLPGNRSFTVLP